MRKEKFVYRGCAIAVVLFVLCNCKPRRDESVFKVVGGREAQAGEVPATVRIPDCSATRISKHHLLTAAHCVLDDDRELSEEYVPGKSIRVDYGIRLGDNKNISTIVRRVLVHNSYLEDLGADAASDVALIEIETELPDDVKIASIRQAPLRPGTDFVLFTGYGCEELPSYMRPSIDGGAFVEDDGFSAVEMELRLKTSREPLAGIVGVNGILSSRSPNQLAVGEQEEFSGCPGDSGSGVYWAYDEDGPHLEVVGVNSYINLFRTVFARLDGEVENGVHQCLLKFLNDPERANRCLRVWGG